MKANTADAWVQARVQKYGPVSKLSLFGNPTVLIHGPAANKFVFSGDSSTVANQQTKSVKMILGDRNLLELSGEDHKRVRNALVPFLKPESLKQYVEKMDWEVREHLKTHWIGKQKVQVLPLMKNLTFNIICTLLFGIERGIRRDDLIKCFQHMIRGMWSIPVKLPFTTFSRAIRARWKAEKILKEVIEEKRAEIGQNSNSNPRDLISSLLSSGSREDEAITEEEILHNSMLVMVAGHDTSSVLITFIVRLLANEPAVYSAVLQEQEEIAKSKAPGEVLTWEDLTTMKYTWRVALETMRVFPPLFGGFRTAVRDIEYDGYLIPKGWQIFWVSSMTHMDESIFPEPSKFNPDRYENQLSVPPYCFVGFGGGPRICPGNEFARIETLVTIHYLVTRFSWKMCSDNSFSRNPMPSPSQGLEVQITQNKTIVTA
ncbi:hypothetical protein CRG98_011904 [Punica granatum]|nr:hypothetical protein CRG98_011904 [Punica granatum]